LPNQFLGNNWITQLPESVQAAIVAKMRPKQCARGEVVYHEGELPDAFWQVISGSIRLTNISTDGKEVVFAIFTHGDCLGEISIIDGKPASNTATAVEPVELQEISRKDFNSLNQTYPQISHQLNLLLTQRMRHMIRFYEDIALRPQETRLAHRLCYLTGNLPRKNSAIPATIEIKLTQQDIAAMLGASRQSISKILNQWQDNDIIQIEYGRIIILDANYLTALAQ